MSGSQVDLVTDVTLKTGTRVRVRPVSVEDEPRLVAFYDALSPETLVRRFFGGKRRVRREWIHALATADDHQRVVFVAEHDSAVIGVIEYELSRDGDTAEAGLVVHDDWQNNGLGTILFRALFRAAEQRGVSWFRLYVQAGNVRILNIIYRLADVLERRTERGVTELVVSQRFHDERI